MRMNTFSVGATALLLAAAAAPAQWQQLTPATSPSARSGAGMTFNSISGNVLLFGGFVGFSASNETWSYNGSTWSQLAPTTSPTAKAGVELVCDTGSGVVVMYGGVNTSPFGGASVDQTWEWNGTSWTQVFPTTTPGGLGNYGASYDLARSRVVVYGGTANSFFPIAESGTWEWNGTNWSLITTVGTPGPLERPAMCYHAGLGRTVLFGGIDPQTGGVDTTWLYDGTNWTAATVVGPKPTARTGAKMVYDSTRNVCVMTGGADPNTGAPIVETWEFDGTRWSQAANAPTGRYDAGLAYLPGSRRTLQFGGINPVTFTTLADTWDYSRAAVIGTGCAGSNGVPELAATTGPRLGQNYTLTLDNLNPVLPIAVMVLSLTTIPATPLAGIGMPGCTAYISPDLLLTVSATAGTSSNALGIPNTTSLVGVSLFAQGLSLDTVNAAGLTASNALDGMINP